jgi:hypothetical protein
MEMLMKVANGIIQLGLAIALILAGITMVYLAYTLYFNSDMGSFVALCLVSLGTFIPAGEYGYLGIKEFVPKTLQANIDIVRLSGRKFTK